MKILMFLSEKKNIDVGDTYEFFSSTHITAS